MDMRSGRTVLLGIIGLIALSYLCVACTVESHKPVNLPTIEEFTFSYLPSYISGSTVELKWRVSGANNVRIEPAIGQVDLYGTRITNISENTTYILTATNDSGHVTRSITVGAGTIAGYIPFAPPEIEGYTRYVDFENGFALNYPSNWIVDNESVSKMGPLMGLIFSGVSFSNNKPGSDFAHYDVLFRAVDPGFDKRIFTEEYKEHCLAKGYSLTYEKTWRIADDYNAVRQDYSHTVNGREYEHMAVFEVHDGKFWVERYETPIDLQIWTMYYSSSFLR